MYKLICVSQENVTHPGAQLHTTRVPDDNPASYSLVQEANPHPTKYDLAHTTCRVCIYIIYVCMPPQKWIVLFQYLQHVH